MTCHRQSFDIEIILCGIRVDSPAGASVLTNAGGSGAFTRTQYAASAVVQRSEHAVGLSLCKHHHAGIVHVVHEIHKHVAIRCIAAGDMRKCGTAVVFLFLHRRIADFVIAAIFIAPDMIQIQPMPDFMVAVLPLLKVPSSVPTVPNALY